VARLALHHLLGSRLPGLEARRQEIGQSLQLVPQDLPVGEPRDQHQGRQQQAGHRTGPDPGLFLDAGQRQALVGQALLGGLAGVENHDLGLGVQRAKLLDRPGHLFGLVGPGQRQHQGLDAAVVGSPATEEDLTGGHGHRVQSRDQVGHPGGRQSHVQGVGTRQVDDLAEVLGFEPGREFLPPGRQMPHHLTPGPRLVVNLRKDGGALLVKHAVQNSLQLDSGRGAGPRLLDAEDLRPRIVVIQDLFVTPPLARQPDGAPLAHPNPMPPSRTTQTDPSISAVRLNLEAGARQVPHLS